MPQTSDWDLTWGEGLHRGEHVTTRSSVQAFLGLVLMEGKGGHGSMRGMQGPSRAEEAQIQAGWLPQAVRREGVWATATWVPTGFLKTGRDLREERCAG